MRTALQTGSDAGLDLVVKNIPGKKKGVYSERDIPNGGFVAEYAGTYLTGDAARQKERELSGKTPEENLFFFKHNDKWSW